VTGAASIPGQKRLKRLRRLSPLHSYANGGASILNGTSGTSCKLINMPAAFCLSSCAVPIIIY